MATKRSIGTSISAGISAVSSVLEALPNTVERTGKVLSLTADVSELYLENWVQSKKSENRIEKVDRWSKMEQLRVASNQAGITQANNVKDFLAEIDNIDV